MTIEELAARVAKCRDTAQETSEALEQAEVIASAAQMDLHSAKRALDEAVAELVEQQRTAV